MSQFIGKRGVLQIKLYVLVVQAQSVALLCANLKMKQSYSIVGSDFSALLAVRKYQQMLVCAAKRERSANYFKY